MDGGGGALLEGAGVRSLPPFKHRYWGAMVLEKEGGDVKWVSPNNGWASTSSSFFVRHAMGMCNAHAHTSSSLLSNASVQ